MAREKTSPTTTTVAWDERFEKTFRAFAEENNLTFARNDNFQPQTPPKYGRATPRNKAPAFSFYLHEPGSLKSLSCLMGSYKSSSWPYAYINKGFYSPFTKKWFMVERCGMIADGPTDINPRFLADEEFFTTFLARQRSNLVNPVAWLKTAREPMLCPKCFNPMAVRTRKMDSKPFWGCYSYPTCTFSCNMSPEQQADYQLHPMSR